MILCGGPGRRLWPLVDTHTPKPVLTVGGRSLLSHTIRRVADSGHYAPPLIVTSADSVGAIARELTAIGCADLPVLIEPAPRDTAAAILSAALYLRQTQPDATLLVLPADHAINEEAAFHAAMQQSIAAAAAGFLVCFGITPHSPETAYGYIRPGAACDAHARHVQAFVEKPDAASAAAYLAEGYLWNSGMFVFSVERIIEEAEIHAVATLAACEQAIAHSWREGVRTYLGRALNHAPRQPIDRAIMERTSHAAVVPLACAWSDLGSYASLWRAAAKDEAGNAFNGRVRARHAQHNFVDVPQQETLLLGVSDLVVVQRNERLLIAHKDQLDGLKQLADSSEAAAVMSHATESSG